MIRGRYGQRSKMFPSKGQVSRFKIWYLTFAILLLAFALRVYHLDSQSIWWDEGHSIQMASASLARIPTLPGMDVHPPGYFFTLHLWMTVAGRSEYALRYLSVVFSLLTVSLMMRFAWTLAGRWSAWRRVGVGMMAGGLAALSPLYVAYAQEVRMYAMVTFFALASVYFQWRIFIGWKAEQLKGQRVGPDTFQVPRGRSPVWLVVGYLLTTAASLYTHYFTVFLILFQNLAWLGWVMIPRIGNELRSRRIALWLGSQSAILLLLSPQLPLALRQTTAYANPNLNPPGLAEFLARSWLAYTLGSAIDRGAKIWSAALLAVILGLVLLFQFKSTRRKMCSGQLSTTAFLIGWFLFPLVAYFLVLQRRPSFQPRYMMLVTPGLVLLLAWGLGAAFRREDRAGRWFWWSGLGFLVAWAVFGMGTWFYFTDIGSYKDDSAGVVNWLAAEATPNDVVFVDVPHPFHYYADRVPAPLRYLFVDIHTAAEVLNAEAAGRDRLFWVTWWGSDTDPRGVIPFLLEKAGHRAGELDFRGYHVTWWDLQPDSHFSLPTDLLPIEVTFGDVTRLDGLAFSETVKPGGVVWATLHFTLLRDTDVDYRVSLRLRSSTGEMLPPIDKDLLNDRHFRTSAWPMDDSRLNQAINVYTLPLPSDISPGDYCLEVVLYEATTLEAIPTTGNSTFVCPFPVENGVSAPLGTVVVLP